MEAYKRIRSRNISRISDDSLLSNRDMSVAEIEQRFSNEDLGTTMLPIVTSASFIRRLGKKVLNSYLAGIVLTFFTLFALFGDDVRVLAFALKHDNYFFSASAVCLGAFLMDLSLSTWLRPGYLGSFYFYLDALSTISLIPDIGWIWNVFIDSARGDGESTLAQIQNAGKASRAGARSSKIVRILRLLRLIRLVKLYNNSHLPRTTPSLPPPPDPLSIPEESKIGKKMSELTTKRVIAVVLLLLISLPILDLTFLGTSLRSWDYGGHILDLYMNSEGYLTVMHQFLNYHQNDFRPIIFLSLQTTEHAIVWKSNVEPSELRIGEKYYATSEYTVAIFDIRNDTRLEALLNICKTMFVCGVFALGAVYLTKAANDLVIIPIEKMMNKVKRIAKNPLAAQIDKMKDIYDIREDSDAHRCCEPITSNELETLILENSIMKISALLALSFGEAGSSVIAENLKKGGELDSMLAGKRTTAIFGFCDIRNFTDTTEILQEDVMIFVNEIAEIVHHVVDAHLGAANKNIGDAFLLVWKIDPEQTNPCYMQNLADLSLISFLKILADLNRSRKLQRYRSHAGLLRRMPKYTVRLGCGLHYGWAIEGSIGSEMKIDASYLSPHVNMVAQLEEATKTYGVPLLISNSLFEIMSPDTRVRCRHIDTLLLRGAKVKLYTFDIDLSLASKAKFKTYSKVRSKRKRTRLIQSMQDIDFMTTALFQLSKTLVRIRALVDPSFIHNFGEAISAYECGDWKRCQTLLISGLATCPNDQPSKVLLSFMEGYGFAPPATWSGFRELPSIV